MKITIVKSFRNLVEGDVYDFDALSEVGAVCVVGENGCGKSSLTQALRGHFNNKPTKSLYEWDFKKLALNIQVQHKYEKIFHYDSVKDNGTDMNVAYDAVEYISSGGFQTKNNSHGEANFIQFLLWFKEIKGQIIPSKTLLVLDEVDNGLSIKRQSEVYQWLCKIVFEHKANVLIISHNPFLMTKLTGVYDFANKKYMYSRDYIREQTGIELNYEKTEQ